MDDLLLFTPDTKSHKAMLKDFLKALLKNGLRISPKKCQLLKRALQYIGNNIFIKGKTVYVKLLRMMVQAIQKMELPTTSKS